jgi:5,10-methylenetetrahydromethanopterin reductase
MREAIMKLGVCVLWGESQDEFLDQVRLAEELKYGLIGIGESPAGWRSLPVSMALASQNTTKATIAPMVTSPFMRHPLVDANDMATLQEISGGRIAHGLATGGSTIMAISHAPALQTEIREYIHALKDLMDGKPATWEGRPVSPLRFPRKVPIYYSAFGPKALALAGEMADGVILFTNGDLEEYDRKIAIVHEAARKAGRNPKDIDVWVISFCAIRDNKVDARNDLRAFIVCNGLQFRTPETFATVPTQFKGKIEELQRRYDTSEHVVVNGKNTKLLDELGLTEFLANYDCVYGTPDDVSPVLNGLAERGVSVFVAALPGHAAKLDVMRRLREVWPQSRERA